MTAIFSLHGASSPHRRMVNPSLDHPRRRGWRLHPQRRSLPVAFRPFLRFQLARHGFTFGIAFVTSISRSIPPAISPSRAQPSACHQSS